MFRFARNFVVDIENKKIIGFDMSYLVDGDTDVGVGGEWCLVTKTSTAKMLLKNMTVKMWINMCV